MIELEEVALIKTSDEVLEQLLAHGRIMIGHTQSGSNGSSSWTCYRG